MHSNDLLHLYLTEISRIPLLNDDEQKSLAKQAKEGNSAARQTLIESNLRLVVSVAKNHVNKGLPLMDLIQEGSKGLIRAVDKFDYTLGFRLSTYATYWIEQSIRKALNENAQIKLPANVLNEILNLHRIEEALTQELERSPSLIELSRKIGVSDSQIEKIKSYVKLTSLSSLDRTINEDNNSDLYNLVSSDERVDIELEKRLLKEKIHEMLIQLDKIELYVIANLYGFNNIQVLSYTELAVQLEMSINDVRAIEERALFHLRYLSLEYNVKHLVS